MCLKVISKNPIRRFAGRFCAVPRQGKPSVRAAYTSVSLSPAIRLAECSAAIAAAPDPTQKRLANPPHMVFRGAL